MHSDVCNHDECSRENGEPNDIFPQSQVVESKSTQDRCAGYFDVETVFVIDQSKECDFVDNESFKAVVEDRELQYISKESLVGCSNNGLRSAATVPPWVSHRG